MSGRTFNIDRFAVIALFAAGFAGGCASSPTCRSAHSISPGEYLAIGTIATTSFSVQGQRIDNGAQYDGYNRETGSFSYAAYGLDGRLGTGMQGMEAGAGFNGDMLGADLKYQLLNRGRPEKWALAIDLSAGTSLNSDYETSAALLLSSPQPGFQVDLSGRFGCYQRTEKDGGKDIRNPQNALGWWPNQYQFYELGFGMRFDLSSRTALALAGTVKNLFPQPIYDGYSDWEFNDTYSPVVTLGLSALFGAVSPFSATAGKAPQPLKAGKSPLKMGVEDRIVLAGKLAAGGMVQDAIDEWMIVSEDQRHAFEAFKALGSCYARLEQPTAALYYFRRALELEPDDPEVKKAVKELNGISGK